MAESDGDAEIADVGALISALLVKVLVEAMAVIAGKDDKSLVGNTRLLEKVHKLSHPTVVIPDSVDVLVKVAMPLVVHVSMGQVVLVREILGCIPGMVGRARKVRHPHALVVGGGVGDELAEVRHKDRLGVGKVVDLVVKNVRLIEAPILLKLSPGDDVLEAKLGIKLFLSVVLLHLGLKESGLPLQISEIVIVRGNVFLGAVEEIEDLGDTRLVGVGVGFVKLLDGHGIRTAVVGAVTLGGHCGGGVAADDVDATISFLGRVVPLELGGLVGLAIRVGEAHGLSSEPLDVRRQLRQALVDSLSVLLVAGVQDEVVDVRALLEGPEFLSQTLHEDKHDVLDLDRPIAKSLLQSGENFGIKVGDLQRIVDRVVIRAMLPDVRALVGESILLITQRSIVAILVPQGIPPKETTGQSLGKPVNGSVLIGQSSIAAPARVPARRPALVKFTVGISPGRVRNELGEGERVVDKLALLGAEIGFRLEDVEQRHGEGDGHVIVGLGGSQNEGDGDEDGHDDLVDPGWNEGHEPHELAPWRQRLLWGVEVGVAMTTVEVIVA